MDSGRLATLAAESGDDDPISALAAVAALRVEVERVEAAAVRRARNAGFTWHSIAVVLGVSRQAVHKKHGRR